MQKDERVVLVFTRFYIITQSKGGGFFNVICSRLASRMINLSFCFSYFLSFVFLSFTSFVTGRL